MGMKTATQLKKERERREKSKEAAKARRKKRIAEGKPVFGGGIDRNPNTRGYLFDRKAPDNKTLQTQTDIEKGTSRVGSKNKKPNFVEKAMGPKSDVTSADLAKVKPASTSRASTTKINPVGGSLGSGNIDAAISKRPMSQPAAKMSPRASAKTGANNPPKKTGAFDDFYARRDKRRKGDVDVDVDNSAAMDFIGGVDIPGPASKLPGMKKGGKVKAKAKTKAKTKGKVRGAGIAKKGVRKCKMR
tara:strand:+ start:587 stop:1321 length:735 start_codon:yes stop_codon:yes gene_type:complete